MAFSDLPWPSASFSQVSVQYTTKNQEALAGKDYVAVSGELVWKDGESDEREIKIEIIDDDVYEQDEHFTVVLSEVAVRLELTPYSHAC